MPKNDSIFIDVIFSLRCWQSEHRQTNDMSRKLYCFYFQFNPTNISWIWAWLSFFLRLRCTFNVVWVDDIDSRASHWYQCMAIHLFFVTSDSEYIIACNKSKVHLSLLLPFCPLFECTEISIQIGHKSIVNAVTPDTFRIYMMIEIESEFQLKVNYFRWQRSQTDSILCLSLSVPLSMWTRIFLHHFHSTDTKHFGNHWFLFFYWYWHPFYPLLSIYKVTHAHTTSWQISSAIRRMYTSILYFTIAF